MLGISKETVHGLPEVHYPGRVILIDSAAKARDAVAYLMKQKQIGFDTETRPSFTKNLRYKVSLMQLSTPGECFLFRLKMIGSLEPLMKVLENPDIQKIGLSLKDDFHSLAKLCDFTPAGFVELQTFVKDFEIADNSLQKIYALIFNSRISKNQRLTNWEAPALTESQQNYAAIDAWACVEIYNHLCAGKFHPEECPYKIDDETAMMLQSSVGIHAPLKHSCSDSNTDPSDNDALDDQLIARLSSSDSSEVKKPRRKSSRSKAKTVAESNAEVPTKEKVSKAKAAPKAKASTKTKAAAKKKAVTKEEPKTKEASATKKPLKAEPASRIITDSGAKTPAKKKATDKPKTTSRKSTATV